MNIQTEKHTLTEELLWSYYKIEFKSKYKHLFLILILIFISLVSYGLWGLINNTSINNWLPYIIILVSWAIIMLMLQLSKQKATLKTNYTKSELIESVYKFSNEFIEQNRVDGSIVKIRWENTYKISVKEKYIIIYQNPFSAILIPTDAFKSESDRQVILSKIETINSD